MADKHPQRLYAALRYVDPNAAIAWLERAFGFTEHVVYRNDAGEVEHAELRAGGELFFLGQSREGGVDVRSPRETGSRSASLYLVVDDVDACYARAKDAGATVVRELQNTEYGSREFTVRDLDGHSWSFGTYRPPR